MTITVRADDLDHFRLMLREQIAGDVELLREVGAGVAEQHDAGEVRDRLELVWALASQVGGLYADAPPEAA